jgi:hypothetical protein
VSIDELGICFMRVWPVGDVIEELWLLRLRDVTAVPAAETLPALAERLRSTLLGDHVGFESIDRRLEGTDVGVQWLRGFEGTSTSVDRVRLDDELYARATDAIVATLDAEQLLEPADRAALVRAATEVALFRQRPGARVVRCEPAEESSEPPWRFQCTVASEPRSRVDDEYEVIVHDRLGLFCYRRWLNPG